MTCADYILGPIMENDGFPFDDDSRSDLNSHLERLAEEHPEIAEPLKNWRGSKLDRKKRTGESTAGRSTPSSGNSTPAASDKETPHVTPETTQEQSKPEFAKERRGLETKLRNTVPDMRREQEEEADRVGRSQSAPPSQQAPSDNQPNHSQQPPTREPVVRHIPIFVEGRDEPVIPKDFVDSPFPREKRNISREASPIPPVRKSTQEPPVHQEQPKHTSSVHINHSGSHTQPDRTVPIEIKINTEQGSKQAGQAPRQQTPQPPSQPTQPKIILGPLEKVHAVQEEVGNLMAKVEQYSGNNRQDKEYVYLDEMLTRNLLKLDDIETEGKDDVRTARKEAIRQIQRCISQLENKAPITGGSTSDNPSFESIPNETPSEQSLTQSSSNDFKPLPSSNTTSSDSMAIEKPQSEPTGPS